MSDVNRMKDLRVLIVCEHASQVFGGEAILPLQYFKRLREKNVNAWLVTHGRVKSHLQEVMPEYMEYIFFIPDTKGHVFFHKLGGYLPDRIRVFTTGFIGHLITQIYQIKIVRKQIKDKKINVVHEPAPVSPKQPSVMFFLGVPVIVGPLNGGINFPDSFQYMQGKFEKIFYKVGRLFSLVLNVFMPGKLLANIILVANQRTKKALPLFIQGQVIELVENGVDLDLWKFRKPSKLKKPIQFVFMGRLIDLKCVDLLIQAFSKIESEAKLVIIGDGKIRSELELLARESKARNEIEFLGWMPQIECSQKLIESDVLVLPSVRECGGAVVLEAMAVGLPVIAVNWGGPADYITPETGILIEPSDKNLFVQELSNAMQLLADDENKRLSMGVEARKRVEEQFDWNKKVNNIIDIYRSIL